MVLAVLDGWSFRLFCLILHRFGMFVLVPFALFCCLLKLGRLEVAPLESLLNFAMCQDANQSAIAGNGEAHPTGLMI